MRKRRKKRRTGGWIRREKDKEDGIGEKEEQTWTGRFIYKEGKYGKRKRTRTGKYT